MKYILYAAVGMYRAMYMATFSFICQVFFGAYKTKLYIFLYVYANVYTLYEKTFACMCECGGTHTFQYAHERIHIRICFCSCIYFPCTSERTLFVTLISERLSTVQASEPARRGSRHLTYERISRLYR